MAFGYAIEKKIPSEIDGELLRKLAGVATSGFGREMTYEDVKNHVKESEGVMIAYDEKIHEPVGFASYEVYENIGNLVGAVVKSDFQGKGVYKELNKSRMEDFVYRGLEYVVTRTQNPLVYLDVSKYCDAIYPDENERPTEDTLKIARKVYSNCDDDLIVRKCYGSKLASKYAIPNEKVSKIFSRLDIEQGDAFVIVGKLK